MTQLIENKRRRRVLIATLSRFSPRPRRFVGRSLSSDITDGARSAYRCKSLADRAAQVPGKGSLGDNSPAEGLAALWRAACTDSRLFIALISNRRCCRLEMAVSNCKQRRAMVSNRRKMAALQFPFSCSKIAPDGANPEIGVPREGEGCPPEGRPLHRQGRGENQKSRRDAGATWARGGSRLECRTFLRLRPAELLLLDGDRQSLWRLRHAVDSDREVGGHVSDRGAWISAAGAATAASPASGAYC
jgi:hypothetical protein